MTNYEIAEFVLIFLGIVIIILIFGSIIYVAYIAAKRKDVPFQNINHNDLKSNQTSSETIINIEPLTVHKHTAVDIEPIVGMTNPSTGAVMINSLVDSTGHAYGM